MRMRGSGHRRPSRNRGTWAAVAWMLVAMTQSCQAPEDPEPAIPAASQSELLPAPHPDLGAADPAVRERLDSERQRLEDLLAASATPDLLGAGFGIMGRLYHAHDFISAATACYRNAVRLAPEELSWHYHLGTVLQHQGLLDEAAEELRAALDLEPDDVAALRRLGDVERARQQPQEAERSYRRALEVDPSCYAAVFGLAEIDRGRGDLEAAAGHYQAILAAQPDALQVHYPLAQILLRLGKQEPAQDHLRQSAEFDPRAAGGRATCQDPLDDELQLLMTGAPVHLERGRLAAEAGDAEGELAQYRKAVELAPDMPMALQTLGRALAQRGELQEAIALYRRAVELESGNADLHHDLGLLSLGLGRPEAAADEFRAALEIDPGHAGALLQTGLDLQRRGRAADALALYERILAAEPSHRAARMQRALCLMQLGRRPQAAAALAEILDGEPPADPASRLRLAMAVGVLGDDDRALRHLGAVLALAADVPTRVQAHNAIAALLDRRGDAAGAAEHRASARTLAAAVPQ